MKVSDFRVVGGKYTKFLMSYLKPQVTFSFKLHHSSLLWEISLLYFFSETLFDFYKRNPPQCKISDFWLFRWNITKFVLWKCIKFQLKKEWRSYVSWYQRAIVYTPAPFCRGVEPPTKFSKKGGLDGSSAFRGELLGKRGMTFFRVGRVCNFYIKNKLKSEIFNDKKFISKNIFLCHN